MYLMRFGLTPIWRWARPTPTTSLLPRLQVVTPFYSLGGIPGENTGVFEARAGVNALLLPVRGASLSFEALPQTVGFDAQGIGDNPITLEIDGSEAHEQFD